MQPRQVCAFPSSGFTRCHGTDGQRVGGKEGPQDEGFLIYGSAIFHRGIAVSLHRLAFQQIPSMFGFDWRTVSDASLSPFLKHEGLIYTSSPTALAYSRHATDSTTGLKLGFRPLAIFIGLSSVYGIALVPQVWPFGPNWASPEMLVKTRHDRPWRRKMPSWGRGHAALRRTKRQRNPSVFVGFESALLRLKLRPAKKSRTSTRTML